MKNADLTKGNINSLLKKIAIPASVGFAFNTLFNVVDSLYAGQISTDTLAGMAISFPIFFLIISISSGFGNGATALSAIAIGKKDVKAFHSYALNSILLAIIVGVLLPILSPLFLEPLFRLSGSTGNVLQVGMDYTTLIIYGTIFFVLNFVLNGLLSAQGNTKPFRNYLIIGFFANLILDPLFILGWFGLPMMGVQGVALATIIVQAFGSVYLAYHLTKSHLFDMKLFKEARPSLDTIRALLKQGIPSSLNNATIALGVFVINYFVLLYGGTETVAAYGVSMRIEQMALLPTIGISVAVLSIVGQNYGAGKIDRIYEVRKKATMYGVGIMLIGTVIIVPLAPFLVSLFDSSDVVVNAGKQYLRIEALAFTTYIFLNIGVSVLQGIKKPKFGIWIGLYRQLLPIGLFYFLGTTLGMGILGVWWGIVFINWTAVFITIAYTKLQLRKIEPPMIESLAV